MIQPETKTLETIHVGDHEKRVQPPPQSLATTVHDIMREQLEYLIELAEEDRLGDRSAADRYRLARVALLEMIFSEPQPAAKLVTVRL